MIEVGLVHLQHDALGRGVDAERFTDRQGEFADPERAVVVGRCARAARRGVGGEDPAVLIEIGM